MLSAADVEQKTFSTALRGYDLDEVDDFLDEVVATIKQLQGQLDEAIAAREESTSVGAVTVVAPEPEPTDQVEPEAVEQADPVVREIDESAIGRALVAAQSAADKLLAEAEGEASRIVDEARTEADSMAEQRDARKREVEAEIAALGSRITSVRSELSLLAGEVSEKLDDMDAVLEGEGEPDTTAPEDVEGEREPAAKDVGEVDEDEPTPGYLVGGDVPGGSTSDEMVVAVDDDDVVAANDIDAGGGSPDHLDEILTGVANDLQLDPDNVDSDDSSDVSGPEDDWRDEDE